MRDGRGRDWPVQGNPTARSSAPLGRSSLVDAAAATMAGRPTYGRARAPRSGRSVLARRVASQREIQALAT